MVDTEEHLGKTLKKQDFKFVTRDVINIKYRFMHCNILILLLITNFDLVDAFLFVRVIELI